MVDSELGRQPGAPPAHPRCLSPALRVAGTEFLGARRCELGLNGMRTRNQEGLVLGHSHLQLLLWCPAMMACISAGGRCCK